MLGAKFYKDNLNLEEYSACAEWCNTTQQGYIVDKGEYYECVEIPSLPLDEVKSQKIQELKSARDTEELSPIEYNGFLWDFDDKAQMRINGAIIVLGNNSITWTSADNQEVNGVTVEHLKAIVAQASIRSNAVHVKYRQLKALVEEAETVEAVNAIEWGE